MPAEKSGVKGLVEVQTSLGCAVMLAVMLARFRLYPGSHAAHSASESPR